MHPLLNQARFFHSQKFPESATNAEVIAKIKASKHEDVLVEENEDDSEGEKEEEEEKKDVEDLTKKMEQMDLES